MTKFILKYKGTNQTDIKKMSAILAANQALLLDSSLLPETALIAIEDFNLQHLMADLDGERTIHPEKFTRFPAAENLSKKVYNKWEFA